MKYLTLNYWMLKLGYRPTHWSDERMRELWEAYCYVLKTHKPTTLSWAFKTKVTLSVKKVKK